MARIGSAPDLSLMGVQATVYGKKIGGGSRPNSAIHSTKKRPSNAFDYEYSVVESLPHTHDAHGWPIVSKEKKTNTPIVGRSRANSAGTVKSFHSEQGAPRTNKSALLRQRLIAIERKQNEFSAPTTFKKKNSRVVSATRRKPMKSQENTQRSGFGDDAEEISIKKQMKTSPDDVNRRSSGNVYSFLGQTEPPDYETTQKPNPNVMKLNLASLDDTPRPLRHQPSPKALPIVDKVPTARKTQMLDDIFESTVPKTNTPTQPVKRSPPRPSLGVNHAESHDVHDQTHASDDAHHEQSSDDEAHLFHDHEHEHQPSDDDHEHHQLSDDDHEHHQPSNDNHEHHQLSDDDHEHHHPSNDNHEHQPSDDDHDRVHSADNQEHPLQAQVPSVPAHPEATTEQREPSKMVQNSPKEPPRRPPSARQPSARPASKADTNLDDIFQQKPRRMASFSTQDDTSDNTLPHQRPPPLSSSLQGSPAFTNSHSFGHFGSPNHNGQGGFFADIADTDRTTHRPSAREFYANQRSIRNSRLDTSNGNDKSSPTSTASQVDDAESLTSGRTNVETPPPPIVDNNHRAEKISSRPTTSQTVLPRLPDVPDHGVVEKIDSIKDYLHKVNTIDDERRFEIDHIMTNRSIQLSDTPPNKLKNSDVQDSLVILVQQMIEEKRTLTDLCSKLLQQMQITTSKLVDIESRQEKSLIALIERRNGIKIDEVLHSERKEKTNTLENVDWKQKYEDFITFHTQEMSNLRQKNENEIERIKNEFQSSKQLLPPQGNDFECQTEIELERINGPEVVEISLQTDEIDNHGDSLDDETDPEQTVNGVSSDHHGVKNRLLNVSEEKNQLESLLGERNTEIEKLKSQLTQVVDEQAEFASKLSSKMTNRIEDLQGENATLKKQLDELLKRCNELASLLNANLTPKTHENVVEP